MAAWRGFIKWLYKKLLPGGRHGLHRARDSRPPHRVAVTHVIILDGTTASLLPGFESNAGRVYRLLSKERGVHLNLYYEAGLQWQDWRSTLGIMMGRGLNRQIRRAYGRLASRYKPGDRIYLLGFSRGAYAVRSLAGAIDKVGLLRAEEATERNVRTAWRHYQTPPSAPVSEAFRRAYCHDTLPIEMVGVWDTVMALGLRLPVLWRLGAKAYEFHSAALGESVLRGYQALALDETRVAYQPVIWKTGPETRADVRQVWFRGAHSDIGGQLAGFEAARPLANIPLVWMLERCEEAGLPLPEGWRAHYGRDATAPSVGTWRGWRKVFLIRARRTVGADPSESIHESAQESVRERRKTLWAK